MQAGRAAAAAGLVLLALHTPALTSSASNCQPSSRDPGGGSGERLGLVFAGGGSKAAYEAGLALALRDRGVVPAAVAGTSSGALTAVMVAAGEVDRLATLWRTVRREDVFDYRPGTVFGGLLPGWLALSYLRGTRSLLDPTPLRQTLERHVDFSRVRTSSVRVLILAADLLSGQPRRFDNATVTVEALMASTTVPGLFPPVSLDGALLVDGGIIQRAPTLELLDAHPLDRLLVVLGYESEAPRGGTVQAVLERGFELALSREIVRDVELARVRHPSVHVQIVRPSQPLQVRPLDFDGQRLGRLVDLGRSDGLLCLDVLGYGR